ncbi:MAG: prolipoprotein diacylglyceryl transferase [Planktotalea sp.]|jgi:phosphatidylglycerol:prolipoprotein diacylglycerol transferase|uniref:prolipoprotein diacylglyceryl transferase n=2 Tax=Planktotalea sp. TaxID=2029877 RepID=UPI00018394F0|nr:prolipoprotein diacylglyceryl transferase [Planktotalea sp.]EDZ43593.1 prolipoprotein diacylglyceryl transferase [Rhodobacteraceae bacterium HTCC2083]MBT5820785.1 prolipoprotein diacylglyceryl transferase [Paracoccaceae bacterium]MDG1078303.1 prolipoprotein diacylglyceryl transferase [Planktotalea sp.]HCW82699.1 prolipoprotein diacylglyceryl transferase [Paracoccaceae bacterium]
MRAVIQFPPISPEIFSIELFGFDFALRWYAMAYIIGILIGWRLALMAVKAARLWPDNASPMKPAQVEDLLTSVILGVIVGGRLGYVVFYQPAYYLAHPLEALMIWQGGMSFHGGLLGVIAAGLYFCARTGISKLHTADMMALAVAPALFLGRVSNFVNSELWGRPTDLPWGVIFPDRAAQACGPFIDICARHPSQLYEAILEGLLLGTFILWLVWRRDALKKPGIIMGTFFAGYGIGRFLVEFARQPDAQFITLENPLGLVLQTGGYGFTMGQLLSIPMILIGIWFIIRARKA